MRTGVSLLDMPLLDLVSLWSCYCRSCFVFFCKCIFIYIYIYMVISYRYMDISCRFMYMEICVVDGMPR